MQSKFLPGYVQTTKLYFNSLPNVNKTVSKCLMGNTLFKPRFWKMLPSSSVVVILGCTGTGKSKLAIHLAKKFNGEVISADSMQVYKGLDIVTNKVTPEEQKEAVHHLINCVDPLSRYTVVDFRNKALPLIHRLLKENKMPIIVGGTNYYIESLLWEVLVKPQEEGNKLLWDEEGRNENKLSGDSLNFTDISLLLQQKITQDSVQDVPNDILHKALQQVDPVMANTLHPGDRRKVIRSLQVYQQHGRTHSEILANQRSQDGGSTLGGPLRFKNSVMLWLQCEKKVLEQRLNDRVDDMIKRGLVDELLDFHKCYNEKRLASEKPSYTEGIFQSIGFKEFHEYLILPEEKRNEASGKKALDKAIEDMKLVTRQYARKQMKWIVNRFLRKPDRQVPPVYGLDATNLDLWKENVLDPAAEIIQAVKKNRIPSQKPLPLQESLQDVPETHYCEVCDRIFVGRRTWEIHINSKKHSKIKASLKKADKKAKEQVIML